MAKHFVLFQGSAKSDAMMATDLARALGRTLIESGLRIMITGGDGLDADLGSTARARCVDLGLDPREEIRTYPYPEALLTGFGRIIPSPEEWYQEHRTFVVDEAAALVAVAGGKGTADVIQKARLAGKPVLAVATASGRAADEWRRMRREGYFNETPGDIDFLADHSFDAESMASRVADECRRLLERPRSSYSERIFVVHGHDEALKSQLARMLEKLKLKAVVLHEQPDGGRAIFVKLREVMEDVGFGFVLMTPDDAMDAGGAPSLRRARQNVVFEHGLLVGMLGAQRVCAIVKGDVDIPSDIHGVIYKKLREDQTVDAIALDLGKELKAAGYTVDLNLLAGD